jgi:hypothetical protein
MGMTVAQAIAALGRFSPDDAVMVSTDPFGDVSLNHPLADVQVTADGRAVMVAGGRDDDTPRCGACGRVTRRADESFVCRACDAETDERGVIVGYGLDLLQGIDR